MFFTNPVRVYPEKAKDIGDTTMDEKGFIPSEERLENELDGTVSIYGIDNSISSDKDKKRCYICLQHSLIFGSNIYNVVLFYKAPVALWMHEQCFYRAMSRARQHYLDLFEVAGVHSEDLISEEEHPEFPTVEILDK